MFSACFSAKRPNTVSFDSKDRASLPIKHSRASILVVILLLSLISQLPQLLILLPKLLIARHLLLVSLVVNARLDGDSQTPLHGGPGEDPLPPALEVGELVEVDAAEVGDVDPAEVGNVGDAVLVADEVLAGGEVGVEDAVEALGLADVALGRVGDALLG